MRWRERTLGEVVRFRRGYDLPEQARAPGTVPVIGSAGQNGWHNEARAKGPGVSIGRSGASIGKVTYTPLDYWPHNTCLYVTDFLGNDSHFVYYFLQTQDLTLLNSGAAQPSLNRNFVHTLPVRVPGPNEQFAIASFLSTYDDLIENNRRRIALLAAAAQLLFREWFVHFRFPGHEHVVVSNGTPEGWECFALSELADFINGYAFKPTQLGDIGLPIVKIPELRRGVTEKTPRNDGELIPEKYHLKDGDLLFSWSGTLAVNVWAGGPALLNQHLFHVVPSGRVGRGLLMCAIREALAALENRTVGATMKHIRRSALEQVYVALGDRSLTAPVEDILHNTYEQLVVLHQQNQKLAQARDLLLPRLMNGEIAV